MLCLLGVKLALPLIQMLAAKSFIFISLRAFYVKICPHHLIKRRDRLSINAYMMITIVMMMMMIIIIIIINIVIIVIIIITIIIPSSSFSIT